MKPIKIGLAFFSYHPKEGPTTLFSEATDHYAMSLIIYD